MSAKMGRPKVSNPINVRTSVRLDAETDEKLIEYARLNKITKGAAIREGVKLLLSEKGQKK